MQKINNNPFRVIGIVANSSAKEIQSRRGKIQAYARVGRESSSEYDFEFLEPITRSEEVLNKAFSEIEQHKNIVDHSLFWFMNLNPIDETAIQHLINGNKEKAIEIWEKITEGKEVSSRNFSAFNNIGTLYFLEGSEDKLKRGIEYKIKLIESDHFQTFVHSVADEMYTIDSEKQVQFLIDDLLKQINGKYSTPEKIALFDGNPSVKTYLFGKFTEEPLHRIETQIEQSKKKRANDKINSYRFGSDLFANTKVDLSQVKSILGISDLKYKMISDKVAKEILQCSIDYFNGCQDLGKETDYIEEAVQLAKTAEAIAVNKLTKDRIKDNLATMEGMKDQELSQAILVLKSIKAAYEKACKQIDKQVDDLQYMDMGYARVRNYDVSVNWNKVAKMKSEALNWDKVVEVVSNSISMKDISTIQRSSDNSKISEYKNLVDFLLSKLGPIQINQVKYICYWKDVRAAQAKSTVKKVGTTISSATDNGCYIATMAYGDYDHPQVIELRRFRDDFLIKTIIGRSFINFYYRYSPILVEKLKAKKNINLIIRKGLDQFIKVIKR